MTRTSSQTFLSAMAFSDKDRQSPLHNNICLYLRQTDKLKKLVRVVAPDLDSKIESELIHKTHLYSCIYEKQWGDPFGGALVHVPDYSPYNCYFESCPPHHDYREEFFAKLSEPLKNVNVNYHQIVGYADLLVGFHLEAKLVYKFDRAKQDANSYCGPNNFTTSEELTAKIQAVKLITLKRTFDIALNPNRADDKWSVILVEVKAYRTHVSDIIQQMKTYRELCGCGLQVLAAGYPLTPVEKDTLLEHKIHAIYVSPQAVDEFLKSQVSTAIEEF